MPGKSFFDLLAPVYGRVIPGLFERVTSRVAQRLAAGAPQTVLEVGTGPGRFLTEISHASNLKMQVVGIDLSRGMLEQARQHLKPDTEAVELVQADALHLPFGDGRFEGAVAMFFFDVVVEDHIRDALIEIARTVAPGGRVVIASIQISNPLVANLWKKVYEVSPDIPGAIRPVEYDQHLAAAGLRVLKDETVESVIGARVLTLVKVLG